MSELRPCPHCDTPAFIAEDVCGGDDEGIRYAVTCQKLDCIGGTPWHFSRDSLVRQWNRRADPPVGTRYRNEAGDVVAVVAPAKASSKGLGFWGGGALYKADTSQGMVALSEHVFDFMLAALPEPE